MSNESKLQQTKSSFKLEGIVTGLERDNAFREGVIAQGKSAGKEYRSIKFGIQTSEVNTIFVEMFGMEGDYVYPFKRGENGQKGTSKKIPFADRHNPPAGYNIIGIGLGLEFDGGKTVNQSKVEYDSVEYIREHLMNGDSVNVEGDIRFSQYENKRTGEVTNQITYTIRRLYKKNKPIDFHDEKFEEVSSFRQEIVFVSGDFNKEDGKVHVMAYTIGYKDKFSEALFTIDPKRSDSTKKLAETFLKKMKFGDWIEVFGDCINKVELSESAEEVEEDFWGEKPKAFNRTIKNYITELQIIGADGNTYEKGKYNEEDFVVEEFVESGGSYGTGTTKDEPLDIDDDDLPF
jgi:hypothetical protein